VTASFSWLLAAEIVRDIVAQADIPMTMGHYLRSMKQLANQWTPHNFRDERRQRLYLKDIDCPPEWAAHLATIIPPNLWYLNENVDERPGKARNDDLNLFPSGRSPAPAGDLMSSLPEEMRAQNLMCYIGHEGTYTPAHREMCGSLGHNIMVDASGDENGEKPGSSIWFMTETKDREVVREYFLSMLGHDIEIEKHFAQINAWKKATFPVYIVEQKVGDFILIPPLAAHQVWNRGTRTMKVAWNRTTVETLQNALHEALPKARLVCRDEQYKNKAIIYYTLDKYYKIMTEAEKTADIGFLGFAQDLIKSSTRMKQLASDFKALFKLYTEILVDEMFATREKEVEYIPYDSNITCSYCRANIFNRFLTCKNCIRTLVTGDEDTYDICMECYIMGRSCFCVSNLTWCEQWRWSELVDKYETWRALIIKNDGYISFDSSPLPLELERKRTGKKSAAQICQEQLRKRPFNDITKVKQMPDHEGSEIEVDENGRRIKKKGRKKKKGNVYRCHVCAHKDYTYKLAFCTNEGCTDAYCYGVLYRAFDLMPQDVMQNERWQCPKCLEICNCGSCRRAGNGTPYIPKSTFIGHDTRRIADDRSVESLVDFRVHNLSWLKIGGDEGRSVSSKRMQRLLQAAEAEKAKHVELVGDGLTNGVTAQTLTAALQQSAANGCSAQGKNTEPDVAPMGVYPAPGVESIREHARPVAVAGASIRGDESSYPDPTILGRERMLGMGYYEQDDSPDKILFDPYQAPTTESLVINDEPKMSEYLKKQLRLAKRRAHQEEDGDPDFRASRSHYRKKPKLDDNQPVQRDHQEIALSNMDPALFNAYTTITEAPTNGEQRALPPETAPQRTEESSIEPLASAAPREESLHRPVLRHARSKMSYAEQNNAEDDIDEVINSRLQKPPESITYFNGDDAEKDPLDVAAAAVRSMAAPTAAAAPVVPPTPNIPTTTGTGRKRGRPRKSEAAPPQLEPQREPTPQPEPGREQKREGSQPEQPRRRRGRPPKARPSTSAPPESEKEPEDDIDAQLARPLDAFNDNGEAIAQEAEQALTEEVRVAPEPPRRRGRPPRNPQPKPQPQPSPPPARRTEFMIELPSQPLMSITERMRMRGKKVKIVGRKSTSQGSAAPVSSKSATPARESIHRETGSARSSVARETPPRRRTTEEIDKDFDPTAEEEAASTDRRAFTRATAPRSTSISASLSRSCSHSLPALAAIEPSASASEESQSESRSRSPHPLPRVPFGLTIIRLGDDSDDEEDGSYQACDSRDQESGSEYGAGRGRLDAAAATQEPVSEYESSDDEDEDIPARKLTASVNGRGSGHRGWGGARGGGRGRGRRDRGRGRKSN